MTPAKNYWNKLVLLEFNEFGEVVLGHVDIEKYISLFLTQPGTSSVINTANNCLILMDYSDGFPWLKAELSLTIY